MADSAELVIVVGARPDFMKVAPILRALLEQGSPLKPRVVHTGQHYDVNMSKVFLEQLNISGIVRFLGVGSGPHGFQTARICEEFEYYLLSRREPPRGVLVVGDVNSTIACTLASVKLNIPVAHVEAGLRSDDRTRPEEINRVVTDALSDVLFVSEPNGMHRLRREGIAPSKVEFVGNVMVDTLVDLLPLALTQGMLSNLRVEAQEYALVTVHKPENVDRKDRLAGLVNLLDRVSNDIPVVFPVHPRTQSRLIEYKLDKRLRKKPRVSMLEALGYLEHLNVMANARLVLTDSGGIQEETSYLGVPCLTLRSTTERPITITRGTNTLVGQDLDLAFKLVQDILRGETKTGFPIEGWDGQAANRIVRTLAEKWSPAGIRANQEPVLV